MRNNRKTKSITYEPHPPNSDAERERENCRYHLISSCCNSCRIVTSLLKLYMSQVTQLTTPPKKSVAVLEETLRTMTSVVKGSSGRRWIRGEAIGRGSLGTVFQAMDQQTGELLAVKEGWRKMN